MRGWQRKINELLTTKNRLFFFHLISGLLWNGKCFGVAYALSMQNNDEETKIKMNVRIDFFCSLRVFSPWVGVRYTFLTFTSYILFYLSFFWFGLWLETSPSQLFYSLLPTKKKPPNYERLRAGSNANIFSFSMHIFHNATGFYSSSSCFHDFGWYKSQGH